MRLVLASASPRRAEILRGLGFSIDVHPAEVREDPLPDELPDVHVERLARLKAEVVSERFPDRWVLAGDTVVVHGGMILGKPKSAEDAVRMLVRLQGESHRVVSALALVRPAFEVGTGGARILSGVQDTTVHFQPFDRAVAEAYVRTGEPMDKAGAYGIQGRGATIVTRIEGDYTNVVGLPVSLLVRLLEGAGRPYRFDLRR
ncbi:MAG: septum formation protein Maf [Gemmatimonadetes bacterium]|nr:septum formation protein Maf [Gemmatimonadota bacterium]